MILILASLADSKVMRIIHSSDTHGWLYGHAHDEKCNGTFGDILTFIQTQKKNNHTIAVDSGDFVQGCGLSDADDPIGAFVNDIWAKQFESDLFYDFVTLGNHDLRSGSVEYYIDNVLDKVKSKTVSLNIMRNDKQLVSKYQFKTINGLNVLFSGMMYELTIDGTYNLSTMKIEKALQDEEFTTAICQADMIVMLIHIGLHQNLGTYFKIYEYIRDLTPNPIFILGGHEHQDGYKYPVFDSKFYNPYPFLLDSDHNDTNVVFMETENYFQQLSLLDFNVTYDPDNAYYQISGVQRQHIYINKTSLDITQQTPEAKAIEDEINAKIQYLNLTEIEGYAPQKYYTPYDKELPFDDPRNIYNLWIKQVVPNYLFTRPGAELPNEKQFFQGSTFFGTSIYEGEVTLDDVYVTSPYKEEVFYVIRTMSGSDLYKLQDDINSGTTTKPHYYSMIALEDIDQTKNYSVVMNSYDYSKISKKFAALNITAERDPNDYTDQNAFSLYDNFVKGAWGQKNE